LSSLSDQEISAFRSRRAFTGSVKKRSEINELIIGGYSPEIFTCAASSQFECTSGDFASRFTPTDALHMLGQFERWNSEASRLGAELLAERLDMPPEKFCHQVITEVSERITTELFRKVISQDAPLPNWEQESTAKALLHLALGKQTSPALDCQIRLKSPVVAIGAPVEAYIPQSVRLLHTESIIPAYSEVANAVGAVVGGVIQRSQVLVHHLEGSERSVFRFYLPDGYQDFDDLEEGVLIVKDGFSERLATLARDAGADHVEIYMQRQDSYASSTDQIDDLYLKTDLYFTAIGRPGMGKSAI
jgi:N-methylhydantoinase A/oxoprolinase/acetone carboxylase beta subunit